MLSSKHTRTYKTDVLALVFDFFVMRMSCFVIWTQSPDRNVPHTNIRTTF